VTYLENPKTFDPLSPGEQWFYYWRTSAVLWESRILQFPKDHIIFLPLFWGLHAESNTSWDFGKIQPERDLFRLAQILTQHRRNFCWVLPLSPAPFFPNGGIPAFTARTFALDKNGVQLAVFDHELNLNKMFSFFDPKVFLAFSGFLKEFGSILNKNNIRSPVWGAEFYFHQDGQNESFLEDYSVAFDQGFSRFLKAENPDGLEISDAKVEKDLKRKYLNQVKQLFVTASESSLGSYWMGKQKIVTLGASPKDTVLRSFPNGKSQLDFTKDLFYQFTTSAFISSALLTQQEKRDLLNSILNENFGSKEIEKKYNLSNSKAGLSEEFTHFGMIDLLGNFKNDRIVSIKLIDYLNSNFRSLFNIQKEPSFTSDWIDTYYERIKIFSGEDLNRSKFSQMLKLFMMGQRIILDRTGLPEDLEKKLQIFLAENNIKVQFVNFITPTQICELGDGILIIFQSDKLCNHPRAESYWTQIFKFFNILQPEVMLDSDVFCLWKIRATSPHELSYLNVRRLSLYNPTSYKKFVNVKTHNHFAFMKMVDPLRANAKSTTEGVEVEILPNGKIALDFGHYEDL
jgi:hypothetical protein